MMVMPRSRSSSMLSITRSATCWLARKTPPWRSRASTSVVLPWSTWAMMATLRRSGLAICVDFGVRDIFSVYPARRASALLAGYPCLFARASRGLDDSVAGPIRRFDEMYTDFMRAAWVTLLLAGATAPGLIGQATAPHLRVELRPSMSQGDVQRVAVEGAGGAARVSALAVGLPVHLAPTSKGSWEGLVGVDLAQNPGKYPVAVTITQPDGTAVQAHSTVVVTARSFPTRRLKVNPRFVEPPPADAERMAADAKRLAEVFASLSDRRWQGTIKPPVDGASTSNFGSRSVFNGQPRAPHAGVD